MAIAAPIAIGIGEIVEGIVGIIEANAARTAVVGVATTAAATLHSDSTPKPATGTNTTTVKGKPKMNCGEDGNYGDLLNKTGANKFDRDHIPSKAALQQAAMDILDTNPELGDQVLTNPNRMKALFGDKAAISKAGQAVAIPKQDHRDHSPTYGKRNSQKQIQKDAENLQEAAKRDTKAMRDADSKEMDPDCFKKYKEAADKIDKKTHAEYEKELTDIINDVIKNIK